MRARALRYAAVGVTALAACGPIRAGKPGDRYVTAEQRAAVLRRAEVWHRTNIPSLDLKAGPQGEGAFAPGATVTCDYAPDKLGGHTPKFACVVNGEEHLKVRYGRDNGEVYAGVAATRLLWALGFGADAMYPVHVVCRGCPPSLHSDGRTPDGATRFDIAAIEQKHPGHDIEARSVGPGWAWPELDLVDEQAGGATRAQRDALKLLAVMLQHTDNKAEQQRLVCLDRSKDRRDVAECRQPLMLVHDVGQTFGRANLLNRSSIGSVNLEGWSKTPVWKDARRCVANMPPSQTGTLEYPIISEAGRAFLADLLNQLSDAQLRDLFTVARFPERIVEGRTDPGAANVDAWVGAFKQKRDEIAAARCF